MSLHSVCRLILKYKEAPSQERRNAVLHQEEPEKCSYISMSLGCDDSKMLRLHYDSCTLEADVVLCTQFIEFWTMQGKPENRARTQALSSAAWALGMTLCVCVIGRVKCPGVSARRCGCSRHEDLPPWKWLLIRPKYENYFIRHNSWSRAHLEKLVVAEPAKKLSAFYGIWRFITVFRKAATGRYSEPDESNPHNHTLFL